MYVKFYCDYYIERDKKGLPLWTSQGIVKEDEFPLSTQLINDMKRLCLLFDKSINPNNPADENWETSIDIRSEFNQLLPKVEEQVRKEMPAYVVLEFEQNRL